MKQERIIIRVSPEEKIAFEAASELSGQSLSSWVRKELRGASIKVLENSNMKIPFIQPMRVK